MSFSCLFGCSDSRLVKPRLQKYRIAILTQCLSIDPCERLYHLWSQHVLKYQMSLASPAAICVSSRFWRSFKIEPGQPWKAHYQRMYFHLRFLWSKLLNLSQSPSRCHGATSLANACRLFVSHWRRQKSLFKSFFRPNQIASFVSLSLL